MYERRNSSSLYSDMKRRRLYLLTLAFIFSLYFSFVYLSIFWPINFTIFSSRRSNRFINELEEVEIENSILVQYIDYRSEKELKLSVEDLSRKLADIKKFIGKYFKLGEKSALGPTRFFAWVFFPYGSMNNDYFGLGGASYQEKIEVEMQCIKDNRKKMEDILFFEKEIDISAEIFCNAVFKFRREVELDLLLQRIKMDNLGLINWDNEIVEDIKRNTKAFSCRINTVIKLSKEDENELCNLEHSLNMVNNSLTLDSKYLHDYLELEPTLRRHVDNLNERLNSVSGDIFQYFAKDKYIELEKEIEESYSRIIEYSYDLYRLLIVLSLNDMILALKKVVMIRGGIDIPMRESNIFDFKFIRIISNDLLEVLNDLVYILEIPEVVSKTNMLISFMVEKGSEFVLQEW